jgi:hypothetical protein
MSGTESTDVDKSHEHDGSISVSGIVFGVVCGLLCRLVYWISTIREEQVVLVKCHIHE